MKEGEVAGKNRGGRSVGDDDRFDDDRAEAEEIEAVDDGAFEDEFDGDDDEAFDDDEADEGAEPGKERRSKVLVSRSGATPAAGRDRDGGPGYFRRIPTFIREVYAELQKVIWPTRKELLTYTSVVVVFVAIMMTIVGLLDLGFAKGLLFVFGSAD
jgi:preprotein translocase subunit SecE